MKLKIEHSTVFEYDAPIYETATEARLRPCDPVDLPQRCLDFNLEVVPPAHVMHYTDFYGNLVHHFNLLHSLQRLEIKATSIVSTSSGRIPAAKDEEVFQQNFLLESRYVRFDAAAQSMAEQFYSQHDPQRRAEEICRYINESFHYEPGVTDVHSTSQEVLATRQGVCQDFAHAMIAVCRCLGTPARYVSGYLYGGSEAQTHDQASHAWCEVYCGPAYGWIGFDPTHDTLLVDERYVRIGIGRDYEDVTLVRGTFKGNAKELLTATVRVQAV